MIFCRATSTSTCHALLLATREASVWRFLSALQSFMKSATPSIPTIWPAPSSSSSRSVKNKKQKQKLTISLCLFFKKKISLSLCVCVVFFWSLFCFHTFFLLLTHLSLSSSICYYSVPLPSADEFYGCLAQIWRDPFKQATIERGN